MNNDRLQNLIIEILPPSPGYIIDMITIFRHIHEICNTLRPIGRLQHLSVRFLENELVAWSTSGKPTASISQDYSSREDDSDVEHCLEHFAMLRMLRQQPLSYPLPSKATRSWQS